MTEVYSRTHSVTIIICSTFSILSAFSKFVTIFDEFFSIGNAGQFDAAALFRTLDADKSGAIDFTELVLALHLEATGSTEERLRWTFRMYDEDADGSGVDTFMFEWLISQHLLTAVELAPKDSPESTTPAAHLILLAQSEAL